MDSFSSLFTSFCFFFKKDVQRHETGVSRRIRRVTASEERRESVVSVVVVVVVVLLFEDKSVLISGDLIDLMS